jgi:hypothetical protein
MPVLHSWAFGPKATAKKKARTHLSFDKDSLKLRTFTP